ncbi:MAG: peptidoglycan-binding protein [Clostridiales bacterium]|jgi:g-D-glutamyl-meso-diaminopimelate peptidase|nr:peptidoglycan-binding protein [Clostridiales bacterium]
MRTLKLGMSGTDVMQIQALLRKMGYRITTIDGIFGTQLEDAIKRFQSSNGLTPDGIIGTQTWNTLNRYLLGYDTYTIKSGDTFYKIAQSYHTNTNLIIAANPGLNATDLQIGTQIIVPYGIDVVDTNISYTYDALKTDITGLKARYPFLEIGAAGSSVLGKDIYYLRLGKGENQVFYNASHHALEWITTPLLMKFAEQYLKSYALGQTLGGRNINELFNNTSIYIIPMVNPDGVDLVLNGLNPDNPYYSRLIEWNNNSTDFSTNWQANIHGVDLNHNYNAAWQLSKDAESAYGITGPGPTRYSGPSPESEPETQSLVNFTRNHNFRLVLAFHSQGQVIYWNFQNMAPAGAKIIGENLSRLSGYALDNATGIASYAGYKDWFIQDFNRPGYTIEVGLGTNPLPISQFNQIYSQNLPMLLYAATV